MTQTAWLVVLLVACGGGGEEVIFEVRRDGYPIAWPEARTGGTWTDVDGVTEIILRQVDSGDPNIADSGGSVVLVVALDSAALVPGAEIRVRGTTTYESRASTASTPPQTERWSPADTSSPVRRAVLYAQCYCHAVRGEASQEHDLVLHVDAIGARLQGRIEGQVVGALGLSIGPAPFDITSDFSLARE